MTRALILDLSRRVSEIERDARGLGKHGCGVLLALEGTQTALARMLDKLDHREEQEV